MVITGIDDEIGQTFAGESPIVKRAWRNKERLLVNIPFAVPKLPTDTRIGNVDGTSTQENSYIFIVPPYDAICHGRRRSAADGHSANPSSVLRNRTVNEGRNGAGMAEETAPIEAGRIPCDYTVSEFRGRVLLTMHSAAVSPCGIPQDRALPQARRGVAGAEDAAT